MKSFISVCVIVMFLLYNVYEVLYFHVLLSCFYCIIYMKSFISMCYCHEGGGGGMVTFFMIFFNPMK